MFAILCVLCVLVLVRTCNYTIILCISAGCSCDIMICRRWITRSLSKLNLCNLNTQKYTKLQKYVPLIGLLKAVVLCIAIVRFVCDRITKRNEKTCEVKKERERERERERAHSEYASFSRGFGACRSIKSKYRSHPYKRLCSSIHDFIGFADTLGWNLANKRNVYDC